MRAISAAFLALGVTLAASVQAQAPQSRIRGTVEKLDGDVMTVKPASGDPVRITLAPGYSVGAVVKATMADVKAGGYIGVGALPKAGGLSAVQVFIFPEAMRGTGEGHKPWGVLPESTMTNATVADTVTSVDGGSVTLKYPGGEQKITVPADANIIMAAGAGPADLASGAQVVMNAGKQADGTLSTSRVTVAKAGARLPL